MKKEKDPNSIWEKICIVPVVLVFVAIICDFTTSAFASSHKQHGGEISYELTDLDEFAAAALKGLVSKDEGKQDFQATAERAYDYAEAMLTEKHVREQK